MQSPSPRLTDVEGLLVGHVTLEDAATGCTVVLGPPDGIRAAARIRGRATGTRELDALSPRHLVPAVHAILLTGGSAFGLGAADGVMRWLAERARGFKAGIAAVPIVPTAVLFDLGPLGRGDRWPGPEDGYRACDAASKTVEEGSVGAGTGATVGKVLGPQGAMKGGVGTWSERRGDLIVGALAVTNPFGDVRDGEGNIIAGARRDGEFADARKVIADGGVRRSSFARGGTNTTLVVVATNADLGQLELVEVAAMATDALTTRITPAGTQFDGDMVFAISTAELPNQPPVQVELLAQDATAMAIERSVRMAKGTAQIPGLADSSSE